MHRLALLIFAIFLVAIQSTTVVYADWDMNSPRQVSALASRNFWQLNDALALYQNASKKPWPVIPDYPRVLKAGDESRAIPLIRQRLEITEDLKQNDDIGGDVFDSELENAVKTFQTRHGLKPDGVIGNTTRAEMNIPPEIRIKQIAMNMQRWANLAGKLGDRFIMVNIPDFNLYLVDDGKRVLSMRAIVGKPDLPTPEISSVITQLEFNPYWNIPPKIVQRDIAPKMLVNPEYADRNHIRIFSDYDDNNEINFHDVDWQRVAEEGTSYHLRQEPGPENALGQVKFVFQNTKDVYLHDTPTKNLFDTDTRDFSHGCVRLENPLALVEYLMNDRPGWNQDKLKEILESGDNKYVKVPHPIPIFITYLTAWVDGDGRVNFRNDLYQLDDPDAPHTDSDADDET